MSNIGNSPQFLSGDTEVAEPPKRPKRPWHVIGPILGALIKVGWEIVRDLVIKK